MSANKKKMAWWGTGAIAMTGLLVALIACTGGAASSNAAATSPATASPRHGSDISQQSAPAAARKAPSNNGFSGERAYEFVAKQVAFGPRPPDTDAIRRTQEYIIGQLRGFGCTVDTDDFHAQTPVGRLAMKNIIVKIKGASPNIIMLATHYDTDTLDPNDRKLTNFVGADDAGSSTGLMMEMALVLCGKPQPATIWIAFLDGEEALKHWDIKTDSVFGSQGIGRIHGRFRRASPSRHSSSPTWWAGRIFTRVETIRPRNGWRILSGTPRRAWAIRICSSTSTWTASRMIISPGKKEMYLPWTSLTLILPMTSVTGTRRRILSTRLVRIHCRSLVT